MTFTRQTLRFLKSKHAKFFAMSQNNFVFRDFLILSYSIPPPPFFSFFSTSWTVEFDEKA